MKALKIFDYLLVIIILFSCWSIIAQAQETYGITITPATFNLNLSPEDSWSSSLKIVNTNPYDVNLYLTVINFKTKKGERFIPILNNPAELNNSLANWIEVKEKEIFIPRAKSFDIQFSINVPLDAPPGGHQAAILVNQRSFDSNSGEAKLSDAATMVASLISINIEGRVNENGVVKKFRPIKKIFFGNLPDFQLVFKNSGNTHLQPRGSINIFNFWGKRVGEIDFPDNNEAGWVAQKTTRESIISPSNQFKNLPSGLYRATLNLSFDKSDKVITRKTFLVSFISEQTSFLFLGIIILCLFLFLGLRIYVKKYTEILWREFYSKIIDKKVYQNKNRKTLKK